MSSSSCPNFALEEARKLLPSQIIDWKIPVSQSACNCLLPLLNTNKLDISDENVHIDSIQLVPNEKKQQKGMHVDLEFIVKFSTSIPDSSMILFNLPNGVYADYYELRNIRHVWASTNPEISVDMTVSDDGFVAMESISGSSSTSSSGRASQLLALHITKNTISASTNTSKDTSTDSDTNNAPVTSASLAAASSKLLRLSLPVHLQYPVAVATIASASIGMNIEGEGKDIDIDKSVDDYRNIIIPMPLVCICKQPNPNQTSNGKDNDKKCYALDLPLPKSLMPIPTVLRVPQASLNDSNFVALTTDTLLILTTLAILFSLLMLK